MPTLSKTRYTSLLPHLIIYCSQKPQTQNMLTPKHAGFVHTIFLISQSNLLIVYNCPPPKSLLGVQLTGQHGTIALHLDLFAHSLNTPKTLIYMAICVFLQLLVRAQITNVFTSTGYIFYSLSF